MIKKKPEPWQIEAVKETYHKFPTKEITKEMILAARRASWLGLMECKKILVDYIEILSRKY